MDVYGYARASTDKQTLTIEAQEEKIRSYCKAKDLALAGFFTDADTTSRIPLKDRKCGQELITGIKEGKVKAVVFAKLDRAFRNVVECLSMLDDWMNLGVSVHIMDLGVDTSTPQGRFFLTVVAAFAERERSLISERTSSAMKSAQSNGKRVSKHPPYGYEMDPNTEYDEKTGLYSGIRKQEKEQAIISDIASFHSEGLGYSEIARKLNERNSRQRNGKAWSRQMVWKILDKSF